MHCPKRSLSLWCSNLLDKNRRLSSTSIVLTLLFFFFFFLLLPKVMGDEPHYLDGRWVREEDCKIRYRR